MEYHTLIHRGETPNPPGRTRIRYLPHLLTILSLVIAPLLQASSLSWRWTDITSCTYIIPPDMVEVDGQTTFGQVNPGDVLCLPAGERPNIKLDNLHGTAEKPIIVRNLDGKVLITGTLFLTGGIGISNSTYLHITGTGESTQCGAQYSVENQNCGIEIARTHKGIKINTHNGTVGNLEIDHIAIHNITEIADELETRGITIHPLDEQLISGLYIHHNYVADTSAEGIYLGAEPHARPYEVLGKIKDIEVSYNLIRNIGFDGIKIKVAIENVKVHHNVLQHTGLSNTPAHRGGIKIAMSVGDYYNNYVLTAYEGIRNGRPLEKPGTRYFNNIVIGGSNAGIEALEENALIYNNTVINAGKSGINAPGVQALVFDNIVVGTKGTPIRGFAENVWNNYVGTTSSVGFVNPESGDFHLLPTSPVIDAGGRNGFFPFIDYHGITRPKGAHPDLGAVEYVSQGHALELLR